MGRLLEKWEDYWRNGKITGEMGRLLEKWGGRLLEKWAITGEMGDYWRNGASTYIIHMYRI
jgi:hypothetical protein